MKQVIIFILLLIVDIVLLRFAGLAPVTVIILNFVVLLILGNDD